MSTCVRHFKGSSCFGCNRSETFFSSLFSLWRSLKVEEERLGTCSATILLLTFLEGACTDFLRVCGIDFGF